MLCILSKMVFFLSKVSKIKFLMLKKQVIYSVLFNGNNNNSNNNDNVAVDKRKTAPKSFGER